MSSRFTSYERDANGGDDAQARRFEGQWTRFSQPDPSGRSYRMSDPQSFNRYTYAGNDPVNRRDPSGLDWIPNIGNVGNVDIPISWGSGGGFLYGFGDFLGGTILDELTPSDSLGGIGLDLTTPNTTTQPQTSCTFNINISGVSGQTLSDMQQELTRIYQSGGQNVVFGHPTQANGGSMNLHVVSEYTGAAANTISQQGIPSNHPGVLGVTVPGSNNAYVNQTNIWAAGNQTDISRPPRGGFGIRASLGTMLGRIGAHETIQHGFLRTPAEGIPLPQDIAFGRYGPNLLARPVSRAFNVGASTTAGLSSLCQH